MKKWQLQPDQIIIREDDNYLAVNKPYGVATLDDRNDPGNSIIFQFRKIWPEIQVCHRLDKETSGALMLSKHPEAYRHLALEFQNRTVRKEYHAVVQGIHDYKLEEVDFPLSTMKNGMVRVDKMGKDSLTYFTTLEVFKKNSLLQCVPITGRTHQIRVHLAALGSPIVADGRYGGKPLFLSEIKKRYSHSKYEDERPLIDRVALHAHSLKFRNISGDTLEVTAPYPKDFDVLIRQLRANKR